MFFFSIKLFERKICIRSTSFSQVKDLEESIKKKDTDLTTLKSEENKLQNAIRGLKKDIEGLKKEIQERDETIQDKVTKLIRQINRIFKSVFYILGKTYL